MSKIAVMGYGVVGSGVVELFYKNKKHIEQKAGCEMDIKYILDIREFNDSPYKDKFVKDINTILNDDEVTLVAECMGGLKPAYNFVKSCLEKGKSVSTSNKELVAEKGDELLAIAKKMNCNFFFEASVGGAIPIIRPLHKCLAANTITEVAGILNGTTNFILTKMINEKMGFKEALRMAQELGYAEKDPTADIEGQDACRKICIISSLVYGKHVYPKNVYTEGITNIDLEDVEFAKIWGGAVKLIASVQQLENGKILPCVSPRIVPNDNLISQVDDVFNAVMVSGDGIDKAMFYGRGAGKLPTASAVVADIIESAKHNRTVFSQEWEPAENADFIESFSQLKARMYFRVDKFNAAIIGNSVKYINNSNSKSIAFVTPVISIEDAEVYAKNLEKHNINVLSRIPILDME